MTEPGEVELRELGDGVVEVALARAAKLNAMTTRMYRQMAEIFTGIAERRDVRCVLLRGADARAFCAGGDIGEFAASIGDEAALRRSAEIGRAATDGLIGCPAPVVAAISGPCFGGGLQFAAACDLRIAAPDATFGVPVKKLGMRAEVEDLHVLLRALGANLSLDLLLTGRTASAAELQARGVLQEIVDDPVARARDVARAIAAGAPEAARWHKAALRALSAPSVAPPVEAALACYASAEFAEGCAAFMAKRAPVFPPPATLSPFSEPE